MLKDLALLTGCLTVSYLLFGQKKTTTKSLVQDGTQTDVVSSERAIFISEAQTSGICQDSKTGGTYFSNPIRGTKNGCKTGDSLIF